MLSPAASCFLSSPVTKKCTHLHCFRDAVIILHAELIIWQGTQWVFVSIIIYMMEKEKKLFGDRYTALAWLQGALSDWRTALRICLTSLWLFFLTGIYFLFFFCMPCSLSVLSKLRDGNYICLLNVSLHYSIHMPPSFPSRHVWGVVSIFLHALSHCCDHLKDKGTPSLRSLC